MSLRWTPAIKPAVAHHLSVRRRLFRQALVKRPLNIACFAHWAAAKKPAAFGFVANPEILPAHNAMHNKFAFLWLAHGWFLASIACSSCFSTRAVSQISFAVVSASNKIFSAVVFIFRSG